MMQEMLAAGSGGGGGGCVTGDTVNVSGSEVSSITTTSQQFTINTGLSTITRFVFMGRAYAYSSGEPKSRHIIAYDADVSTTYYMGAIINSANALGGIGTIGGSYPGSSSNNSYKLGSISGGTVTITSASTASGAPCDNIHWYAE